MAAESSWFNRLKQGLGRTKQTLFRPFEGLLGRKRLDEEFFDDLEAALVQADVGPATAEKLLAGLKERIHREKAGGDPQAVREMLAAEILSVLEPVRYRLDLEERGVVYLAVGVNGVGKTTTLAKFAERMRRAGLKVLMVAGDTFRAAAAEQLQIWGKRLGVDVIRHQAGADPAAVAFDGLAAANSRGYEAVLIDTAGRLHTKTNLIGELQKIRRVVEANLNGRKLRVLLVLDATMGQNVLQQVEIFRDAVGVEASVLTKLDGTAKGGIIIALADRLQMPIAMIGVGENADDLREFEPEEFVKALFGE